MQASELFDLSGQVAFVTGAAGGIGLAMASVLADNGAHVVMGDINQEKLDIAVGLLQSRGLDVAPCYIDVADLEKLADTIAGIGDSHGRLDIVCANAGISADPGPLSEGGAMADINIDTWDKLMRINITSILVTIQAASAKMREQEYGRIIVTSSIAGMSGQRLCGYGYVASKAAVSNLVRQSAIELSQYGVNINAIAPGPFLTDIGGGRLHEKDVAKVFSADVPLGRLGVPTEVHGLVLLLASKASSFMTGSVIPIDGGFSAT